MGGYHCFGRAQFLQQGPSAIHDRGGKGGSMPKPNAIETEDKDLPLRDDIRLLGRILGDTVREQSGEAVFDTVEHIRQNSVSFRRNEDVAARRELEATLNSLRPPRHFRSFAPSAFFRISPISPRTSTTSAAPVLMP